MEYLGLLSTLDDMVSVSRHDNLRAEYHQLKIRTEGLEGKLRDRPASPDLRPDPDVELMEKQLYHMWGYMRCLEERAKREGVDL